MSCNMVLFIFHPSRIRIELKTGGFWHEPAWSMQVQLHCSGVVPFSGVYRAPSTSICFRTSGCVFLKKQLDHDSIKVSRNEKSEKSTDGIGGNADAFAPDLIASGRPGPNRIVPHLPAPAFSSRRKTATPIIAGPNSTFSTTHSPPTIPATHSEVGRGIHCADGFIGWSLQFVATINIWRISTPHPEGILQLSSTPWRLAC